MTTIVTRLFADMKTAEQAVNALQLQNHPSDIMDLIPAGKGADDAMAAARVPEDSAALYGAAMKAGSALVVVRAPFMPTGAARNVMDTMSHFDSVDAGVADENVYIREEVQSTLMDATMDLKVDRTHRYWATWGKERPRGLVSDAFGVRTIYEGPGHKTWGTFAGPITYRKRFFGTFSGPMTYRDRFFGTFAGEPVLRGTRHFGAFLIPLLSKRRASDA